MQSLDSVTLLLSSGSLVMDLDHFVVDTSSEPGRVCLKDEEDWPNVELRELGGVVIGFTAGYEAADSLPPNEKLAVAVGVAYLFDNPSGGVFPDLFYNLLDRRRIVPV